MKQDAAHYCNEEKILTVHLHGQIYTSKFLKFLSTCLRHKIKKSKHLSISLQIFEWSWSSGSWIYNYLCNQWLLTLTLCFWTPLRRGVLEYNFNFLYVTKFFLWLTVGWWFSPNTLVSSTNKPDRHDITEILLKVALNTINYQIFAGLVKCVWWHG